MLNLQLLKDAMVVQEEQLSRLKEQRDVWKRSVLLWDSLQGLFFFEAVVLFLFFLFFLFFFSSSPLFSFNNNNYNK